MFIYGEDPELRRITANAPIYYYGFEEEGNDFVASDLLRSTTGSIFSVHFRGEDLGQFQIPSFGRHNIMNATAVVGLLYIAGFDLDLVREHLKTFGGVKRRFTEKIVNDTVIIDTLPTIQLKSLLLWMRHVKSIQSKEIVAVFQPHTFTRTIALLDEFADALNQADASLLGTDLWIQP